MYVNIVIAGKSKAKGSAFEREIAKFLTKWASGQSKDYWYWRSPSSGAVSTITEANGELSGDIIALIPEGGFLTSKFSIEIKTGYPNSSFHKHLKGVKNDEIRAFWEQSIGDASRSNKYPMLIYKKKGMNILVGVPVGRFNGRVKDLNSIVMHFGDIMPVQFFDMKEFFERITPEYIRDTFK